MVAANPDASGLRRVAFEWGHWDPNDPSGANHMFDQVHATAKTLSATEDGQAAISSLLTDDDVAVRLCAATYSLRWNEGPARTVLEDIRDNDQSLHSMTARYTLKEWDAGRLSLDY